MIDPRIKRAANQRREFGHQEYTKAPWIARQEKGALVTLAHAAMCDGFVVTVGNPRVARNARRGKPSQAQGPGSLIGTMRGMRWRG